MEKPSQEDLQKYFSTNRKYFDELANYYYKFDTEFYTNSIAPFYVRQNPISPTNQTNQREVTCPYCKQSMVPIEYMAVSPARIALFICGGFLFLCSLYLGYFFSFLLGTFFGFITILMFVVGIFFKKIKKRCSKCRMPLPYLMLR